MAVKQKKAELTSYTAIVHCADTMTRYTAFIQLLDVKDADEIDTAIKNWLDDNAGEPEPWTSDCYVLDVLLEGLQAPLDLSHMGLNEMIKKHSVGLTSVRELSFGDDLYAIMYHNKDNAVTCRKFMKHAQGHWVIETEVDEGDYCDGMDWLVELAARNDPDRMYDYTKTLADPF